MVIEKLFRLDQEALNYLKEVQEKYHLKSRSATIDFIVKQHNEIFDECKNQSQLKQDIQKIIQSECNKHT